MNKIKQKGRIQAEKEKNSLRIHNLGRVKLN